MSNQSIEQRLAHVDLFSGIGGFSLGLEQCGFRTVAFCETDPFCRRVLEARWPGVPIYADVTNLGGVPVSGSFNCWPPRRPVGLSELADVRPDWVVIENVQHTWRRWVPELRGALYSIGYASLPLQVSARDVGGVHERRRVFVVANAHGERLRELQGWWRRQGGQVAEKLARAWDSAPARLGTDDGLPDWVDRRRTLGNAVCPPAVELVGLGIRSVA